MDSLEEILNRLAICIRNRAYESLETDWLEIKPVPSTGHAWDSIRDSIGAFLNTRGGVVILGIKDEQDPKRGPMFPVPRPITSRAAVVVYIWFSLPWLACVPQVPHDARGSVMRWMHCEVPERTD